MVNMITIIYNFYLWIYGFFVAKKTNDEQHMNENIYKEVDKEMLRSLYLKKYDKENIKNKQNNIKQISTKSVLNKKYTISELSNSYILPESNYLIKIDVPIINNKENIIYEGSLGIISFFDKTVQIKIYFSKKVKVRVISEKIAEELGLGSDNDDIFSKPISIDDNDIEIYSSKIKFDDFEFDKVAIDTDNSIAKSLSISDDNYLILSNNDIKYISGCGYDLKKNKENKENIEIKNDCVN